MYEKWIEHHENGNPLIRINRDGKLFEPSFLYRVVSKDEYKQIHQRGYIEPSPFYNRIHASSEPQCRYGDIVLQIKYVESDGWVAKWGDELYAVTDRKIPFNRIERVSQCR